MAFPRLGVSLHKIMDEVTPEACECIRSSAVATCEVAPLLFGESGPAAKRAMVREMLARGPARAASVHANFGGRYDFSDLDPVVSQGAVAFAFQAIGLAVELDARIVVVHASGEPILPELRAQRLAQARQALAAIARRCEEAGRTLAVELLPRSCLGNTVEELLQILDGLGAPGAGVCLDTNHLMDRHRDLPATVRQLGRRLVTLHVSDYDGIDEQHWMPGQGVVDWPAFLAALRDIVYEGPFNYECRPAGETLAERLRDLERNFRWMAALSASMK